MIGHVGTRVSALVDGQLPAAEAERLWSHVLVCPPCRAAVEREGWVKTQLAGLAHYPQPPAPGHLRGALSGVCATAYVPPPPSETTPSGERRRAVTFAMLGAGSLGAAMVGVIALSVPAEAPSGDRRGPTTSLTRPSATRPSATVTPAATTAPAAVIGARVAASLNDGTIPR